MSANLHLADAADLDRLEPMIAAYHAEAGVESTEESRRAGLAPLLGGSPHGAAYLIGPTRSPIGYIVVTFGWSLEFGGLDGFVDELYLRRAVRGRGIATEVLSTLPKALASGGVRAMHLEVGQDNDIAIRLYKRAGFRPRKGRMLMSRKL